MLLAILHATAFANTGPMLLTVKQVVFELGVSEATLRRYSKMDGFPPKVILGPKRVAFRREDIESWINARSAGVKSV